MQHFSFSFAALLKYLLSLLQQYLHYYNHTTLNIKVLNLIFLKTKYWPLDKSFNSIQFLSQILMQTNCLIFSISYSVPLYNSCLNSFFWWNYYFFNISWIFINYRFCFPSCVVVRLSCCVYNLVSYKFICCFSCFMDYFFGSSF